MNTNIKVDKSKWWWKCIHINTKVDNDENLETKTQTQKVEGDENAKTQTQI